MKNIISKINVVYGILMVFLIFSVPNNIYGHNSIFPTTVDSINCVKSLTIRILLWNATTTDRDDIQAKLHYQFCHYPLPQSQNADRLCEIVCSNGYTSLCRVSVSVIVERQEDIAPDQRHHYHWIQLVNDPKYIGNAVIFSPNNDNTKPSGKWYKYSPSEILGHLTLHLCGLDDKYCARKKAETIINTMTCSPNPEPNDCCPPLKMDECSLPCPGFSDNDIRVKTSYYSPPGILNLNKVDCGHILAIVRLVFDPLICPLVSPLQCCLAPVTPVGGGRVSPIQCHGDQNGTVTTTISGGVPPYYYEWNNGATSKDISGLTAGTYSQTVTDANNASVTGSYVVTEPAALEASSAITMLRCAGLPEGSIDLTVTGGTTPYVYAWTGPGVVPSAEDQSGLAAGTYGVTITDAHTCETTATAVISEPAALSALVSSLTNVQCYGGATGIATVSASGGTPAYTYLWNNGQTTAMASGLMAGSYMVMVTDANACAAAAMAVVTQPDAITVDAGADQQLCQQYVTILTGNWPPPGGVGNWTLIHKPAGSPAITIFPANSPMVSVAGLQPYETDQYIFRYTITMGTCSNYDEMQVFNKHLPSTPYAGPDQNLCFAVPPLNIFYMAASTPVYGTGMWTQSGVLPAAIIANPLLRNTMITYTTVGTYKFLWTVGNGPCVPNDPDTAMIIVYTPPDVSAGPDVDMCIGSAITIAGSSATGDCMTLLWSTSGLGTFSDPTTLHPVYTPTAGDFAAGSVVLTLKGLVGCCSPCGPAEVQDAMALIFHQHPVPAASVVCNVSCRGFSNGKTNVTVTGGTPPYTYLWNDNLGQNTATATGLTAGTYVVTVTDSFGCNGTSGVTITEPAEGLSATALQTHTVFCNGGNDGTATVTASGGTAGYTYLWNTTPVQTAAVATGLAMGTYTVTVTDAHLCTTTAIAVVTEPPLLLPSAIQTHWVSCKGDNDGILTATATGGTQGYNYMWNTLPPQTSSVATGLIAGTYSVTVTDAHSCKATAIATVTEPDLLTISAVSSGDNCYSYSTGLIDLSVIGGTSSYTYVWNNGATSQDISALIAGSYLVTVTDSHMCIAGDAYIITEPPVWSIGITGSQTVCCEMSTPNTTSVYSATVGGSYLGPVTYQWVIQGGTILSGQNSVSITVNWACCGTGMVWLTISDAMPCLLTTFIPIVINPTPAPVITGLAQVNSGQANVQYCTAFAAGHLYTWTVIGGIVSSGMGTNCITVTWGPYPACGCGSVSVAETFNGCTGSTVYPVSILPGADVRISGYVSYDNTVATWMNGVTIQLRNSSNVIMGTTLTINNPANGQPGFYAFTDLPDGTYSLSASYNGTWGGNNATDALIVQLNVIGASPLSGLRAVVADVNGSTTITALDALYIKLRTVGSISSYPAGDWKFSDTTVTLPGSVLPVNIKALCVGDVNASFFPVVFKETTFLSVVEDGVITVPVNEPFIYNIHSCRDATLGAMTLFLGFDKDRFEVADITNIREGMKYVIGDGVIAMAWADIKPLEVNSGDLLVSLNMQVKHKISEPSHVFTIKAGSEFAGKLAIPYEDFNLKMPDVLTTENPQEITMFNFPNPFNHTTTIVYILPDQGHIRLVLTDLYGKTICILADLLDKSGSHSVTVDPAALNMAPGIYLYKIIFDHSTDTHVKVKKMVFTR